MSCTRRAIMLFVALIAGACQDRSPPQPEDQSVRPARVMVVNLAAQAQQVELVGRVEAARSIDLAFEVSGPLQQLPVREGQQVQRGTLLAALDTTDFELDVREAEVQLRLAERDLSRKLRVFKEHGIARSSVDDARSVRDLQQVRLDQARQKLADASLRAPFDALVAQRFVDNFVNVNAGEPVLRLHAADELYVVANIPERISATLTAEDVARIYCTFAFSGEEQFPLEFRENRGEADRVAQSIEASFALQRSERWNVMPGMTARVHILLKESRMPVVTLPVDAVVADAQKRLSVWVLNAQNQKVERRYIQAQGTSASGDIVVAEGLNDGDVVVTTGAAALQEGMRVRPMDSSERV